VIVARRRRLRCRRSSE